MTVCEARQIHEAGSAEDVLDFDAPELGAKHPEQLDLAIGTRCEVRMPPLRRDGEQPPIDPVQQRLAEARSRRNHRRVAVGLHEPSCSSTISSGVSISALAAIASRSFSRCARAPRKYSLDLRGADIPGNVGQSRATGDDGPRDTDGGRLDADRRADQPGERLEDLREAAVCRRRERMDHDRTRAPSPRSKRPSSVFVPPTSAARKGICNLPSSNENP